MRVRGKTVLEEESRGVLAVAVFFFFPVIMTGGRFQWRDPPCSYSSSRKGMSGIIASSMEGDEASDDDDGDGDD